MLLEDVYDMVQKDSVATFSMLGKVASFIDVVIVAATGEGYGG